MREIKFRAWFAPLDWETEKKKPGRMVYFDEMGYCDEYNHLRFQLAESSLDPDGGCYSNLSGNMEDFDSVMQYTGLKDKNGREIYEGDILRGIEYPFEGTFTVRWNEERSGWVPYLEPPKVEVMGNIHENPELLK